MSFRLKEAVYKIRCREPGCTFVSEFIVKENFMGVTEADVDSEAIKIAKNMAFIKHDALHGRKHQLANPEIFKISSAYDRIGGLTADSVYTPGGAAPAAAAQGAPGRAFRRGDIIMRRQEDDGLVVEVLRGAVQNVGHPGLRYRPGAVIGSAAIFHQKARPTDIVAAEDDTAVMFHDVRELTRSNPGRAKELYDRALEEVFHLMLHLQDSWASLEKKAKKPGPARAASKPKPRAKARPAAARKKPAKPPARKRTAARARKR
jgi:CRP-like cAMP-binding protein